MKLFAVRHRNYISTISQRRWGNLSFLYVEPLRDEDQWDSGEDFIARFFLMRRRHPMLSPGEIKRLVRAGVTAEQRELHAIQGDASSGRLARV